MGFTLLSISFCIGQVLDYHCFMLLFVLEQIAFYIGIILLEKYWFNIVLFFLYLNTIGKVWVSYCFLFLFVLEKYWMN